MSSGAFIEEATGRKVTAYMSTVHIDPDLAVELFVLEPSDEPARDDGPELSAKGRGLLTAPLDEKR